MDGSGIRGLFCLNREKYSIYEISYYLDKFFDLLKMVFIVSLIFELGKVFVKSII